MPFSNGAKLSRLLIDIGTETMRKYFDYIHPPGTLTEALHRNYGKLYKLYKRRIIKPEQLQKLFPPSGDLPALPSTPSSEYDITLLFILLRNICGLVPPGGTSWDQNPPSADESPEADLARIKFYRNKIYGHIVSTNVSDDDFENYWSVLSQALERLNDIVGDGENIRDQITYLKIGNLDEGTDWARLFLDWWENDTRISDLVLENKNATKLNGRLLVTIMVVVTFSLFLLLYIIYELHTFHWDFLFLSSKPYQP